MKLQPHTAEMRAAAFTSGINRDGPVNIVTGTACWLWTRRRCPKGYGRAQVAPNRPLMRANRYAWNLMVGPIPDGMWVLHHCDNRLCVRADPDPTVSHLFLGTNQDNIDDMLAKRAAGIGTVGRYVRGENHPFAALTESDVHDIRVMRAAGEVYTSIARIKGVNKWTIRDVIKGKTWRHVPVRALDTGDKP